MSRSRASATTLAWRRKARTVERVSREMDLVIRAHGITSPQFDVLATLTRHGSLSQQALAGRLLVTKGNVSCVVKRTVRARASLE